MAPPASKLASLLASGVIVLAALAAYCDSFSGPFVLDDSSSIVDNPTIRHLWPPSVPLSPPHGDGQTVEGRPVLNLSLALNYAISGTAVWSYHALNLAIHILAGLTLFGVVRRTFLRWSALRSPPKPGEGGEVRQSSAKAESPTRWSANGVSQRVGDNALPPTFFAFAVALLWTLHPLQTESVTYIIQRAESLMGLFYLLTLYCFIRGVDAGEQGGRRPPGGGRSAFDAAGRLGVGGRPASIWFSLSVAACLFGMATKEVMVSAPLIVLLYDRAFIAGSFRGAWRRRRGLYLALAATWILLADLVWRTGNRGGTSGPGSGVEAWTYWLTQFPALIRYLRLAVWPHPLVFDYGTEWVKNSWKVLPCAALVIGLIAGTGYALLRRPVGGEAVRLRPLGFGGQALGFAGAWFFAILAPTSLVPGNRQTAAEHRMYLALAPVVVLAVVGLHALFFRSRPSGLVRRPVRRTIAFAALVFALAIVLGVITARRNRDYRSLLALYADTVAKQAGNPFAQSNLGVALFSLGRVPEAIGHYEEAIRLRPGYATAHDNLGSALLHIGRAPEAVDQFEEALRLKPNFSDAHHNLGTALISLGRLPEAAGQFEEALRLDPDSAETRNNFGNLLIRLGRAPEAIAQYREALRLDPDFAEADNDLGNALSAEGKEADAIACFEAALRLDPGYPEAHYNFGTALLGMSRPADAVAQFRAAIQLQPDYAAAHDNLGNAFLRLDRVSEAAAEYEEAVQLQPGHAVAHYNLGNAFLRLGRAPEAIAQFREALRLQPDFSEARQMLDRLAPFH